MIVCTACPAGEGHDADLRRRHDLQPRVGLDHLLRVLRERDAPLNGIDQCGDPVGAHGEPQLRGARATTELEAAVAEVDPAALHVGEVLGVHREGAVQQAGRGHPQARDVVRLEQPLVRIHHERVHEVKTDDAVAIGGKCGGTAVGAVDVQPRTGLAADR